MSASGQQKSKPYLPVVLSSHEVGRLHEQLAEIGRGIHKEGSDRNIQLLEYLPVAVYERIKEELGSNIPDETLEQIADTLEQELHARRKVEVFIAVNPSRKTYLKIASWAETLAIPVELEVTVDTAIIGGAIVLLDGKIFDQSLKYILETNGDVRALS